MLYKMDSKGKIRVWDIFVGEKDGVPYYSVMHGQQDGQMQYSHVDVPEGKNIGRANATTADQQCLLEAKALHEKQMSRKGYTESIPSEVPALPMLAHKYKDFAHKINFPAAVSCKIDGLRLIVSIKDGVVKTTSRTGKELLGLAHITDELVNLGQDIVIDGELYSDIYPFEEIVSIVRKKNSLDPRMKDIYFYAFDLINTDPYRQRVVDLDDFIEDLKNTKIVPYYIVDNDAQIKSHHEKFIIDGYEGTMIRNLESKYQPNKRSYDLLKLKDFIDAEFTITGWCVGKGKFANVPTFSFLTHDAKPFEAVPKGNEEIRAEYLNKAGSYIGAQATIRFFEYTNDGIPRFPVMLGVRDYE